MGFRRAILAAFWLSVVTVPLLAQTGERRATLEEIEAVPLWTPRPMGEGTSPSVDLRPWLPPIGEQSMNDCTGWAAAYMAKSYQEAIDQGWRPDVPGRIFSPTFVYNQLNGGRDEGASLLAVARFLQSNGCATLASMPYRPGDYRSQPSPAAMAEAKHFRIASAQRIQSGSQIRAALQQRYVVLLAARVGPTFLGGTFDRWTRELHERDWQMKKPDQPHGLHAMTIVGADDRRQAFLVANSWGTEWNQRGYCWVSYDALEVLDPREEATTFGIYAIVLEDEPYRLAEDERPDVPADRQSLAIRKVASHAGYDTTRKRNRYEFAASLTGQRKALFSIVEVEWRWVGLGKPQTIVSRDPSTGFRVGGVADEPDAEVIAFLRFSDDTREQRRVTLGCQPPSAENRDVRLEFTNRYAGRDAAGNPVWHWQAKPVGRLSDLEDIDHVRYDRSKLDPREPRAEVSRSFDLEVMTTGLAGSAGPLEAVVVFKDGGEKTLRGTPVFDAPVNDSPQLLADVRDMGVADRGRRLFAVTARVLVPVFDGTKIEHVEYDFGPTLGDRTARNDRFVTDFDESVAASRDFRLLATVKYRDGRTVKLDRWIRVGEAGGYDNDERIAVDVEDEYHGRVGATPKWRVALTPVGETEVVRGAKRVTYRHADPRNPWKLTVDRRSDARLRAEVLLDAPADLVATMELADGRTIEVPFRVGLWSPAEDAPRLLLGGYRRDEFIGFQSQPTQRVMVGVSMPSSVRGQVDRVEYHLPSLHDRDRVVVPALADAGGRFVIDRRLEGTTPLLVHVITRDGWSEWIATELSPGVRPLEKVGRHEVRVRVRERWHGVEDGKALHDVEFSLDGPTEEVAKVRRVVVRMPEELFPNGDPIETLDAGNRFRSGILATRGFDAIATLEMIDGTNRTQSLRVFCASPISTDLSARASPRWTTLGDGRRELRTVLWLDGPAAMLGQVVSVAWQFNEAGRGERRDEQTVADAAYGAFGVLAFLDGPQEVRAEVKLRDGGVRTLVVRVQPAREKLEPEVADAFWGYNDAGKPLWLATIRPVGLPVLEGRLTFARYIAPDGQQHHSIDAPDCADSFIIEAATTRDIEYVLGREGVETFKGVRVEPRSATLEDKLALVREVVDTPVGQLLVVRLVGPESRLREVQTVTYSLTSDGQAWKSTRRVRYARTDGFELIRAGNTPTPVVAEVRLRDGRTLELSVGP